MYFLGQPKNNGKQAMNYENQTGKPLGFKAIACQFLG
jgi:hypothetical protein